MFDRTYVIPPRSESHYHHTLEERAPTTESVRLLREMEGAAKAEVIDAIKLGGNGFECVVHAMKLPVSGETALRAVFALNGNQMQAEARFNDIDRPSPQAMYDKLRAEVASKIAAAIAPAMAPLLAPRIF